MSGLHRKLSGNLEANWCSARPASKALRAKWHQWRKTMTTGILTQDLVLADFSLGTIG